MLRELLVENIAVIKRLSIDFDDGFSVLTGETGAGKSLIVDCMNLLLGAKADRDLIRTGEEKASVTGTFSPIGEEVKAVLAENDIDFDGDELTVRRVLTVDGRSKSYLGSTAVTQTFQRDVVGRLVSIHGQNDSQRMLQKSGHLTLLDGYVKPGKLLDGYRVAYATYADLNKQIKVLTQDEGEKERLRDTLTFQIKEIESVRLKDGEEEKLKADAERLNNLEEINRDVRLCYRALNGGEKNGAMDLIGKASDALAHLATMVTLPDGLTERLENARSEVEDVAELVLAYGDDEDGDPAERLDRINARLFEIRRIEKKYGVDIPDVLNYLEKCKSKLETLNNAEGLLADLTAKRVKAYAEVQALGTKLHDARVKGAKALVTAVTETLSFLDMPKVVFDVSVVPTEPSPTGMDDVGFVISTNPGEPLKPLCDVASGGELSRVMLALRSVLNDRDGSETVIFDEIDTGISGKTSRKVGLKMKAIAEGTQVLTVTHSAQIASLGDSHYLIGKSETNGRAETTVVRLDLDARVEEIARILGGIHVTDAGRQTARELIEGKETL